MSKLEGGSKSEIIDRREQRFFAILDASFLITGLFGYVLLFNATKEDLIVFIGVINSYVLLNQLVKASFNFNYILKVAVISIVFSAIYRFLASLAI